MSEDKTEIEIENKMEKDSISLTHLSSLFEGLEQKLTATLEKKFTTFEQKLNAKLEKNSLIAGKPKEAITFSQQLAKNVTSIVGLQEVLSSDVKSLKYIWALLLLAGIVGTGFILIKTTEEYLETPMATKLEAINKYEYPPIVLCHNAWFDMEKARKLGVTADAVKYAEGYLKNEMVQVANVTKAKQEFLDSFYKNNFTNLGDFYFNISMDLIPAEENSSDIQHSTSTYKIRQSLKQWHTPPKKILIDLGVCYVFIFPILKQLQAYHLNPKLDIKRVDKTEGVLQSVNFWRVGFSDQQEYFYADPLNVHESTWNVIKISTKRIITKNTTRYPCYEKHDEDYSMELCLETCKNDLLSELINCDFINQATLKNPITRFCNWFDTFTYNISNKSLTLAQAVTSFQEENLADRFDTCNKKCPHKCVRVFHETSIRRQEQPWDKDSLELKNASLTQMIFYHDGSGMTIISEVETYTLTSLVTAVGGTLGLFLGCTVMTLPQIIIFFVSYVCCRFRSARKGVKKM